MAKHDKKESVIFMAKIVKYDKENDILVIHKGFSSDEKFKANIDVGDLVLDISTNGKVRGMEIVNATKFLTDFTKSDKNHVEATLKNLVDAEFNVSMKPNGIVLFFVVKSAKPKDSIESTIAVPLEKPILN